MIKIIKKEDFKRVKTENSNVSNIVAEILENVKRNGDKAVTFYEKKFGNDLPLKVTEDEISQALKSVDTDYISMLERAAKNIRAFHEKQLPKGYEFSPKDGIILGQRVLPLKRAGLYVPGGTASYPSTVLMNAIPAKIAGVQEVFIATPSPSPNIIAAAKVAGVTEIFRVGGAQAIGALAYGTETVPKVDKITGPGNVYVAEAKRQVYGVVDIDMIAGPSEILIIADRGNPAFIASDILAQAEHDINASAFLVTTSESLARNVQQEVTRQLEGLPRKDIARSAVDNNSAVILVSSLDEAVNLANEISPEHLEICTDNPLSFLPKIINAGSVFLGEYSPEALGDYYAGANHTLPTMGTARFSSPLSVTDFMKTSQYIYYDREALNEASKDIEMFALSEGLHAHAKSITIRRI